MARPKAKELTERELEVMHAFWEHGELSIADAQQRLDSEGRALAYTTVATLVRILCEKDFLTQTTTVRPHRFCPTRSFQDVSGRLVSDLVERVFRGSREALLVRLMEEHQLTPDERARIEQLVHPEQYPPSGSDQSSKTQS
ncbi:MAG: BlaI/MecI/CopY family transcriptional regulator [Pirellulales bacterium]